MVYVFAYQISPFGHIMKGLWNGKFWLILFWLFCVNLASFLTLFDTFYGDL
jgi:hypothetical protein